MKVVVEVLAKTKQIANGVEARVVRDTVTEGGEPVEVTDDWYAQDSAGNVWYLGEDTAEYENGQVVSRAGSFEAGVGGAEAGVAMPADPEPGMSYRQEYLEGEAEDEGAVVTVGEERVEVPFGYFGENVLMTRDLVPTEPHVQELKFYAPGVGPVLAVHTDGAGERAVLEYVPGGGGGHTGEVIDSPAGADRLPAWGRQGDREVGTALLIGRVGLALVFAVAAVAKLADRDRTARTLDEFGVPERLLGAAAIALPLAELAIAAAADLPATATAAAIGALALLALFSLGVAAALRRGERPDCNCFGQVGSKPVGRSTFVRNGLLAALAAAVALGGGGSSFAEAFDGVTGPGASSARESSRSWRRSRSRPGSAGSCSARTGASSRGSSVLERALAGEPRRSSSGALEIGDTVPAFELPDLGGARRSLDELLAPGAPFALLFSDPGCAACGPLLDRLAEAR